MARHKDSRTMVAVDTVVIVDRRLSVDGDGMVRKGELRRGDDPLVQRIPSLFVPWAPPELVDVDPSTFPELTPEEVQ